MHKKEKILISLIFILVFYLLTSITFAKYVIEDIHLVAKINIDRCKPIIQLVDITTSNVGYTTYANKTHIISGHIKIIEKNITRNDLSKDTLQIQVANNLITPNFKSFSLVSENESEKIYEFSFTNSIGNGSLSIIAPQGIVEDKSGLVNDKTTFSTNITIDNIPPVATFKEVESNNQKSIAELTINEPIRPVSYWTLSNNNRTLKKEFSHYISYALPIMDYAQNSSEGMIDIKKATNILLEYGTYDAYSGQTIVTGGSISAPNTITSNSICKSEDIYMRLSGDINESILQGRVYLYTYWKDGARGVCKYSELTYYHGYNPTSANEWITMGDSNSLRYQKKIFTQLGGRGLNLENAVASNVLTPIPSDIAKQYLFGISGIQFRLNTSSEFSIVYQAYVKGVGWLSASSDGEENYYRHDKPISAFRMNLVPKSEKQHLINYWNRDVTSY